MRNKVEHVTAARQCENIQFKMGPTHMRVVNSQSNISQTIVRLSVLLCRAAGLIFSVKTQNVNDEVSL